MMSVAKDSRLKNCTVNGVPVTEWLKEEDDKRRVTQANEVYQSEVRNLAVLGQGIERALPKLARARTPVPHGAAGRAVFYNDNLIRRAKGTMSKPFKTVLENCLDVIFRRAPEEPLTNAKLAEAVGKKGQDVASIVGRFIMRVPDVIVMEGTHTPRTYRVLKTITVEEAYVLYRKSIPIDKQISAKEPVRAVLGGIPQEIKVTVQVSGNINFLFGFKKE